MWHDFTRISAQRQNLYPTGIKVTDTELDAIAIERDTFHGEWNYIIKPLVAI